MMASRGKPELASAWRKVPELSFFDKWSAKVLSTSLPRFSSARASMLPELSALDAKGPLAPRCRRFRSGEPTS